MICQVYYYQNKVELANSNGVSIGDVMPHAMAVLHGVIAKDGALVCDSEPLSCPRCGAVYDLHYSNETGPSQLQLFRYIASENIYNEHPRHHSSIAFRLPASLLNSSFIPSRVGSRP